MKERGLPEIDDGEDIPGLPDELAAEIGKYLDGGGLRALYR